MPLPALDASFFVEEPPEFEFHDGLFHITTKIGGCRFERVMRPSVFFEAIAKAVDTSRKYRGRGAVVSIVPRDKHQAASASGSPSK